MSDDYKLGDRKPIQLQLMISNNSRSSGQGSVTMVGVQNGVEIYNVTLPVSVNGPGNGRIDLPSYQPTAGGEIVWTASVSVNNTIQDTTVKKTQVEGQASSLGSSTEGEHQSTGGEDHSTDDDHMKGSGDD